MDQISPITSKTTRRSRYSLYQSDYETAGEESDNSLYYSVLDDEDNESDNKNKENSISRSNVVSTRRSLFAKCLQNQLNHTPRNEFNKRVSINPSLQSTMSLPMTKKMTVAACSSSILKIDKTQESFNKIESHKNLSHSMNSLQLEKPIAIENMTQVVDSEDNASNDAATDVASEIITINDDNDQSLNNTVVAISDNQTGATPETTTQAAATGIHNDTHKPTATSYENPTATELTSQAANNNISITFGVSNLPVSKRMTIIASSTSDSTNTHVFVSNIPFGSKFLKYRAQSTESYGFPKPKGKTGIPRGKNTIGSSYNSKNSTIRTSVIPIFSQKCKYCDKTFAKKSILDAHLLDKCEKIPPTRHRQLLQSQSSSTNNYK